MFLQTALLILAVSASTLGLPNPDSLANENLERSVTIISRSGWNARAPRGTVAMSTPVNLVIIHHTVTGACTTRDACSRIMRSMQDFHQNTNRWSDIGYNFAVGGDGQAYEGRGWRTVGAHAAGHNSASIGIALIGNFVSAVPPARQITAARQLIARGVQLGFIRPTYRLIGHRAVSATECPGTALYREISRWDRYASRP